MNDVIDRVMERVEFVKMEIGDELWKMPHYCSYSPYQNIPLEEKDEIIAKFTEDKRLDRAVGCMVGMAVGDAVGHPLEFLPACDGPEPHAHSFSLHNMSYTNPLNTFRLMPGQWTDDTSMGLCIADSLIALQKYDGGDIRVRFWNWWFNGYNNCFRNDGTRTQSVGLGGNISKSIDVLINNPGEIPPPRYEADGEDAGIGSLMRLAPIPIFFHNDIGAAIHFGSESSFTTHPGPIASEACSFLSYTIARAIESSEIIGTNVKQFLDVIVTNYLDLLKERSGPEIEKMKALLKSSQPEDGLERCWNWKTNSLDISGTLKRRGDRYNGYRLYPEYFGSYCMDGLAIAIHSVYHTSSFDEAIEKCINFLGDADSTGSVAGQLAGAIYGYSTINEKFIKNLRKWDDSDIALRGILLYELGSSQH
jgi:ADP-ribosyl-[dinitrogen reductase] hydrolase